MVHLPRKERQMLTDLDPRSPRSYRPELTPVFKGSLRLEIPEILVGRATLHEEENAGLRPGPRLCGAFFTSQQACKIESNQVEGAQAHTATKQQLSAA